MPELNKYKLSTSKDLDKEKIQDFISLCVDDITTKLQNVPSYSNQSEESKMKFKTVLYQDFLSELGQNLTRDLMEMSKQNQDFDAFNALMSTENPTEFYGMLATAVSLNPELAKNFLDYIVAIYLSLANRFYISANPEILSLNQALSN
jgi:uncharacterized protein with NRDE domain